jgi:hypothetical protein
MFFEGAILNFEKNISLLWGTILINFSQKQIEIFNLLFENLTGKQMEILEDTNFIYIDYNPFDFRLIDSDSYSLGLNKFFCHEIFLQEKELFSNTKPLFPFSDIQNPGNFKRRKRRTFANDDERRIARIMKNRRTAEESRQRRIRRMKSLEDLAAESDFKEDKLFEEITYLGKLNANQLLKIISKTI